MISVRLFCCHRHFDSGRLWRSIQTFGRYAASFIRRSTSNNALSPTIGIGYFNRSLLEIASQKMRVTRRRTLKLFPTGLLKPGPILHPLRWRLLPRKLASKTIAKGKLFSYRILHHHIMAFYFSTLIVSPVASSYSTRGAHVGSMAATLRYAAEGSCSQSRQ